MTGWIILMLQKTPKEIIYKPCGNIQTYRIEIKNIEITDTLTEEDLIKDILQSLQKIIHNGIEVKVLAGILKENYGITEPCCRGLIEKIQLELNMYSPDMKTLYFV
ncbi:hypothetical protein SDC9_183621 [bioreactor metagenome]|uniref:Uncharacterized protein n=1 Tax=bioreactor metagenome TaxID=1076179 RepID=A0A645HC66_9ZZZZ